MGRGRGAGSRPAAGAAARGAAVGALVAPGTTEPMTVTMWGALVPIPRSAAHATAVGDARRFRALYRPDMQGTVVGDGLGFESTFPYLGWCEYDEVDEYEQPPATLVLGQRSDDGRIVPELSINLATLCALVAERGASAPSASASLGTETRDAKGCVHTRLNSPGDVAALAARWKLGPEWDFDPDEDGVGGHTIGSTWAASGDDALTLRLDHYRYDPFRRDETASVAVADLVAWLAIPPVAEVAPSERPGLGELLHGGRTRGLDAASRGADLGRLGAADEATTDAPRDERSQYDEREQPEVPVHRTRMTTQGQVVGQTDEWTVEGALHREDGPALIERVGEGWRSEHYYRHGKPYRADGLPTIERYERNSELVDQEWTDEHGNPHREDGPARIDYPAEARWAGATAAQMPAIQASDPHTLIELDDARIAEHRYFLDGTQLSQQQWRDELGRRTTRQRLGSSAASGTLADALGGARTRGRG